MAEVQLVFHKMLIATILLIINLAALVFNGVGFMSFWWNIWIYFIEIALYIMFYILMIIIGVKIFK